MPQWIQSIIDYRLLNAINHFSCIKIIVLSNVLLAMATIFKTIPALIVITAPIQTVMIKNNVYLHVH